MSDKLDFKPSSKPHETGGRYLELIEFTLLRHLAKGQVVQGIYGVNVAKVREVVYMPKINPLASSVRGLAGIFELRGVPIPAVNLCQILGDEDAPVLPNQQIIITEFSQKRAGFIVTSTNRIHRISWNNVLPPSTDISACMTGMMLMENKEFLFILDFEKILALIENEVNPKGDSSHTAQSWQPEASTQRLDFGVLLVDDSRLILQNVSNVLKGEGFRVMLAHNGEDALERAKDIMAGRYANFPAIDAVITDLEMPRMDGITLLSHLRKLPGLQSTPILMYSSLSGEVSKKAAEKAGASGYVVKNDIHRLIDLLKQSLDQDFYSLAR